MFISSIHLQYTIVPSLYLQREPIVNKGGVSLFAAGGGFNERDYIHGNCSEKWQIESAGKLQEHFSVIFGNLTVCTHGPFYPIHVSRIFAISQTLVCINSIINSSTQKAK